MTAEEMVGLQLEQRAAEIRSQEKMQFDGFRSWIIIALLCFLSRAVIEDPGNRITYLSGAMVLTAVGRAWLCGVFIDRAGAWVRQIEDRFHSAVTPAEWDEFTWERWKEKNRDPVMQIAATICYLFGPCYLLWLIIDILRVR